MSKPAEELEAPCPSKANPTLVQRPDQVLKGLTPITPAEQRKRGNEKGKGRGRGKGRGKGGRGKGRGKGKRGGKGKSKGSKSKSVRGKNAAEKKSTAKKALPKSKTTKKGPSPGSSQPSQPPAEQVKSRKRRSAAVSPEERLARKQQLSRKSSAYHKAKLRAMKQNLPDDECLRLAKQVTRHEH